MTEAEKIFHQIIEHLPNVMEGKMFGAKSIKVENGKTAAFFWEGNMTFKLDEKSKLEALKIDGAKIGSHLYANDKQMQEWVFIPKEHSEVWLEFCKNAVVNVGKLKRL